jgi:two-component system, chemotaxis family, chemotaxis protein CheY
MRVLLVDDSMTMRRIQKTQLNAIGITDIAEAGDGQQAMDVLRQGGQFDAILLDWNMPVLDGLGFLKLMRADSRFADVKVVMCTSEAEKSRVIEALQAGANNYVVKPFTPEAIKARLGVQ